MGNSINGAQALVQALQAENAQHIFGYPGGANIPVFDALFDSPLELILTRHEQGATHMADGYARASGKAGVVLVTSGPGATNTITGLLTAHMDSVPLVAICGQVTTSHLGLEAFQEADVSGISFPVVKHSYLIKDVHEIPRVVKEAFHLAQTGRPGPVLIDFPKDIAAKQFTPEKEPSLDLPGYRLQNEFDHEECDRIARALSKAKRPVILAGHGALQSGAEAQVLALAERLNAPVTTTLLGKGAIPETHPLSLGMLGMHGTAYANLAVQNCDCILSIGSRWDDRIIGEPKSFCKDAIRMHIDIDPAEHNKMLRVHHFAEGDARPILGYIIPYVTPSDTSEWHKQIAQWRKRHPLQTEGDGLRAPKLLHELNDMVAGDAVYVTDVGQHQMWAAQFLQVTKANHFLSSGGAGTMGFGLPAAIGAQMSRPDELVIAVVGDGGFQMTLPELSTAVNQKLPIKILIIDNRFLGMVRQWQDLFYENRTIGVDLTGNPDFTTIAQAYGMPGFRIESVEQIRPVLQEALRYSDGPCIIHAEVEKELNVFPMIPAGKSYSEMIPEQPKRTNGKKDQKSK